MIGVSDVGAEKDVTARRCIGAKLTDREIDQVLPPFRRGIALSCFEIEECEIGIRLIWADFMRSTSVGGHGPSNVDTCARMSTPLSSESSTPLMLDEWEKTSLSWRLASATMSRARSAGNSRTPSDSIDPAKILIPDRLARSPERPSSPRASQPGCRSDIA